MYRLISCLKTKEIGALLVVLCYLKNSIDSVVCRLACRITSLVLFELVQTQIKLIINLNLSNDLNALLIILSILEKRCRCKPSNRFAIVRSRHRTHHPSCWLSFARSYFFCVFSRVSNVKSSCDIWFWFIMTLASYIGTRYV